MSQLQKSNTLTFAHITANDTSMFPPKELAIVMNSEPTLQIMDYIIKIADIIGPLNITHASKISKNRVCLYLKNKDVLNNLIIQHKNININENQIELRRLITPAKRLILSNVSPSIPHKVIAEELQNKGIKLVSPLNFLKITQNPEYAHILSFRRQVYISLDEKTQIPEKILVTYQETNYSIFLAEEGTQCFVCKRQGHTASQCEYKDNSEQIRTEPVAMEGPQNEQGETRNMNQNQQINQVKPNQSQNNQKLHEINSISTETPASQKRTANEMSSDTVKNKLPEEGITNDEDTSSDTNETFKKIIKKGKKSKKIPIREAILPLQKKMKQNPKKSVITFEELEDFIKNTEDQQNYTDLAKEYTSNTTGLLKMLSELYPQLNNESMKNTFSKIMSKMSDEIKNNKTNKSTTSLESLS